MKPFCKVFMYLFCILHKKYIVVIVITVQEIVNYTGIENFAKEFTLAKVIAGAKVNARLVLTKKSTVFFSYVCNPQFVVFWVLCCGINCKCVPFVYAS